jgi:hypothetical protein
MCGILGQRISGADLVLVINTLECSNYYRSAPLLTELKTNFDIKFIFPEYESKIAVKYLDQKLNLKWDRYDVSFNDSLYNLYRKNLTSECVYFPNNSKNPLMSFPLSQIGMSYFILKTIPGKLKTDTIPIIPDFLFSRDMSFTFDSANVYILEAQFGSLLQLNQLTYAQKIISLPDSFKYEKIEGSVLSEAEMNNSHAIEKQLVDQKAIFRKNVSFEHITCYQDHLFIKASIEYYKIGENNRNSINSRKFILKLGTRDFSQQDIIPLLSGDGYHHSWGPAFISNNLFYLPMGFPHSSKLNEQKKYLMGKYKPAKNGLELVGFDENNLLPEEHQRLHFNYNFLSYISYKNYFTFTFTKRICDINGSGFTIKLLPELDTLAGSKIPEVKTNYMMLAFAVEDPITNFILKFDDGRVKLFSYDYSNNLPFNQIELPVKIKTLWPEEDMFKFISVNSFIHINLRNQYIVKYYW